MIFGRDTLNLLHFKAVNFHRLKQKLRSNVADDFDEKLKIINHKLFKHD